MGKVSGNEDLAVAFALGIVAGMRSQMPLALLSWRIRRMHETNVALAVPGVARATWFAPLATVLACGELIGDKLPMTPSRLDPGPLGGRLLFGGLSGALAARVSRQNPWLGALAGATGATVGAFGGYHARKSVVLATGLPDPLVATGEDALALGLGARVVHALTDR